MDAPRAQSLKKDEKPEFCATLPRPTGRAPPSMSEDSKSISGAMAGRVLGEEPGQQQVEGGGDANRDGHACQDRSRIIWSGD